MRMGNFTLFLIFLGLPALVFLFTRCTKVENITINYNYYGVIKTDATPEENELVRLVNEYRVSIGLNPLIHEVLSSEVCEVRNYLDIQNNENPSHEGWSTMLADAMVNPNNGSHLWGYNYLTPLSLFNAYLSSDRHREVLETANATHIGTSIIERRNYTLIIKY